MSPRTVAEGLTAFGFCFAFYILVGCVNAIFKIGTLDLSLDGKIFVFMIVFFTCCMCLFAMKGFLFGSQLFLEMWFTMDTVGSVYRVTCQGELVAYTPIITGSDKNRYAYIPHFLFGVLYKLPENATQVDFSECTTAPFIPGYFRVGCFFIKLF